MQVYRDISFDWEDYLFDLFIAEDRLKDEKKRWFWADYGIATEIDVAMASHLVIENKKGSPEISPETLEQVVKEAGIHRIAILDAHGCLVNGVWHYSEIREKCIDNCEYDSSLSVEVKEGSTVGTISELIKLPDGFIFPYDTGLIREVHPVDSWIAQQSGKKYGALVLCCCNEDNHRPQIQDTPIFYAEGNIGSNSSYKTKLLKPENMSASSK